MTSAAFRLSHLTAQCSGVVLLLTVAWFTLPGLCAINSRTRARSPSQHASSRLSVISQQLAALLSLAAAVSRRGASRRVCKSNKTGFRAEQTHSKLTAAPQDGPVE